MTSTIFPRDDTDALERPDPVAELGRLNEQLSGLLQSWGQLPDLLGGRFSPLADMEETDDAYVVEVELPGVRRDDIAIDVSRRHLSVSGERKERERVGILRRRERIVGTFACEVDLPGEVDDEHVEAVLDEGVLSIRLPKPVHERPRHVEVRHGT